MNYSSLNSLLGGNYGALCVGSLPFKSAEEAVSFILEKNWIVPFWPELPQADDREVMTARTMGFKEEGSETPGYIPQSASGLYALRDRCKEMGIKFPLLKSQILGPFTTFKSFPAGERKSFSAAFELAAELIVQQMEWQGALLSEQADSIIFVLDEPSLLEWNELTEDVQEELDKIYSYLFVRASELGVHLGIHTCSAFDKAFLNFSVELLSFDLLAQDVNNVLNEELKKCWGDAFARGMICVPGVFKSSVDKQKDFNKEYANSIGLIKDVTRYFNDLTGEDRKYLFSASCGHGFSSAEWLNFLYQKKW